LLASDSEDNGYVWLGSIPGLAATSELIQRANLWETSTHPVVENPETTDICLISTITDTTQQIRKYLQATFSKLQQVDLSKVSACREIP
jgi:hypothetical protein